MGQILHGSARTTEAARRTIQHSQESLNVLAKQYGINPKTVAKWRKCDFVHDAPMGPKEPASTVLKPEEEAMCVAFRRHTLLPLDDCLYALQPTISHLSRSTLHRCYQRHGISRLPDVEGDKPAKKKFKNYPIGYFHIDLAEVRTEEGKLYLFVAIDRTSKFAYVELHDKSDRAISTAFVHNLVKAVPYKIHTILTDNGIRFHPIEIILSMLIKAAVILLLGPPVLAVVVFEVLLNAAAMFNHSNIQLPSGLDRVLRWVLVTPNMHRIHHSTKEDEANSNFGFNLPWWDRLFGTYRDQPRGDYQSMVIGISGYRDPRQVERLLGMLALPWSGDILSYAINRRNRDQK